jgi:ABC-type Co2+ transport system permease subunit
MHKTDHTKKRLLHVLESIIAGVGALLGLSFIGVIAQSAHAMMLMHGFRVIHPPAGANFLIVTQGHLSLAILEGLITLVIVAMSVQRIKQKFLT